MDDADFWRRSGQDARMTMLSLAFPAAWRNFKLVCQRTACFVRGAGCLPRGQFLSECNYLGRHSENQVMGVVKSVTHNRMVKRPFTQGET